MERPNSCLLCNPKDYIDQDAHTPLGAISQLGDGGAPKQVFFRSLDAPTPEAAMTATYPAAQANIESQDYIESPKAFAERREPNWQNR